jgi:hypothetical protein
MTSMMQHEQSDASFSMPNKCALLCRPAPTSLLRGGYEMNDWPVKGAKTGKEKKLAELALSNYAMIIIESLYVDWVQMATMYKPMY